MAYLTVFYVSDVLFVFAWLVGAVWFVDRLLVSLDRRLVLRMSVGELRSVVFWLFGVMLFSLVMFKYVVLSGGPGIAVDSILSGPHGSDQFSYPVAALSVVLVAVGAFRLLRFVARSVGFVSRSS